MSRTDVVARAAIAVSRRRQMARLLESLELMTSVKPRSYQNAAQRRGFTPDNPAVDESRAESFRAAWLTSRARG